MKGLFSLKVVLVEYAHGPLNPGNLQLYLWLLQMFSAPLRGRSLQL